MNRPPLFLAGSLSLLAALTPLATGAENPGAAGADNPAVAGEEAGARAKDVDAGQEPQKGAEEEKRAGGENNGDPGFRTGVMEGYQLTQRMFKKPRDYFKKALGDPGMKKYYEKSNFCQDQRNRAEKDPEDLLEYLPDEHAAYVFVPESYAAEGGWGVFLHIGPEKKEMLPEGWRAVLERQKLIYVAPYGLLPKAPDMLRLAICLDALATVQNDYPSLKQGRVIVSGEVESAAVATVMLMNYCELFCGLISHNWAAVLSRTEYGDTVGKANLEDWERREYWNQEVPGIGSSQHRKLLRKDLRFVFYSGYRTGPLTERVLRGAYTWMRHKYEMLMMDLPRLDSDLLPDNWLEAAILWIELGKKAAPEGLPHPRWDQYGILSPRGRRER